jgi:hypothetical protein
MKYENTNNVICFAGLKHAALFFDRVLPISFKQLRGGFNKETEFLIPEPIPMFAFSHVVFGTDQPTGMFKRFSHLSSFMDQWEEFIKTIDPFRLTTAKSSVDDDYSDVQDLYLQNVLLGDGRSIRQVFQSFAKNLGVDFASVLLDNSTSDNGFEYPSMTLLNLPMIDAENAEWEQIIELRKNTKAKSKLRRLRLFLHNNYSGKPLSYVEDDLLSRIEEYDTTRRALGFNATISSLGILLDSKSLQIAGAGGLAAMLFGGPIAGLSTAVVIEIGKFSLELARHRHKIREFENGHQLAYLVDARSKFTGYIT